MDRERGNPFIACHECDALQRAGAPPEGTLLRCACCGARLYGNPRGGLDTPLALSFASLIFFLLANLYPLLTLQVAGHSRATTLSGASWALVTADMPVLGALVWTTSVLGPGLIILSSVYVLSSLRLGREFAGVRLLLAWISRLQPWGMMDVFMLGVLVSLVKLAGIADVVLGPGLFSFGALILSFAASTSRMELHLLWERLEAVRER